MERAGIKRLDVNDNAHNTDERVIGDCREGYKVNECRVGEGSTQ